MKTIALTVSALFTLATAVANGPAKTATIDTKESKLEWVGEKVTGKHWGTVNIKDGSLNMEDGKLTGGTINLDMTSIVATDLEGEWKDKLEGHLKSPDFFAVEANPTSTFVIEKAKAQKGSNGNTHVISGTLTIKGIAKKVSFPARVTVDGNKLTAYASFELNRTEWDIKYGSGSFFDNLGDKTIYDEFQVKFNIVATM